MYYPAYVVFLSQLYRQIDLKIVVDEVEIFIDTALTNGKWGVSARIFSSQGRIPSSVKECLSGVSSFKWQANGPHLKTDLDRGTVLLVQEIHPLSTYSEFKQFLSQFLEFYRMWKEFLEVPARVC